MELMLRQLADALQARGWMLATAESCTGGWIAKVCTDLAGSSVWFERGFVTYSNESKQDMLGVKAETLAQYGAVSEAVTAEMATGALRHSRAQVAVSVSGIAGPGGGTATKPVGMVCFGWAVNGGVYTETCRFAGDREAVRLQSVEHALRGVLHCLDMK
ncbi:MAG: nicotinamide-nucleotide amidase [Candidatus Thiothrix moscowensis]|nr:nicotinamide-nucleotide amidase [Candidatus Thiothrix moscowensis]